MSSTAAPPASAAPSLSFSDVRLLGLVVDINRGDSVDLITVRLKTRSGESLQLQLEVEPGAPVQLGDAVRALGEMGANGRVLCRRPFGEFVSVGRVKVEPPGVAPSGEPGRQQALPPQEKPANPSPLPTGSGPQPRPLNNSAGWSTSPPPPMNNTAGFRGPPPPPPSSANSAATRRPPQANPAKAPEPDRRPATPSFVTQQAGQALVSSGPDENDQSDARGPLRGAHGVENRGFIPSSDAIDRAIPF